MYRRDGSGCFATRSAALKGAEGGRKQADRFRV